MRQNRVKTVYFDREVILDMLNAFNSLQCLRLPVMPEIPEDARVEEVFFDNCRRCWGAMISHPSFPAIAPGALPEVVQADPFVQRCMFRREPLPYADEPEQRTLEVAFERLEKCHIAPAEAERLWQNNPTFHSAITMWLHGACDWTMAMTTWAFSVTGVAAAFQRQHSAGDPVYYDRETGQLFPLRRKHHKRDEKAFVADWHGVPQLLSDTEFEKNVLGGPLAPSIGDVAVWTGARWKRLAAGDDELFEAAAAIESLIADSPAASGNEVRINAGDAVYSGPDGKLRPCPNFPTLAGKSAASRSIFEASDKAHSQAYAGRTSEGRVLPKFSGAGVTSFNFGELPPAFAAQLDAQHAAEVKAADELRAACERYGRCAVVVGDKIAAEVDGIEPLLGVGEIQEWRLPDFAAAAIQKCQKSLGIPADLWGIAPGQEATATLESEPAPNPTPQTEGERMMDFFGSRTKLPDGAMSGD